MTFLPMCQRVFAQQRSFVLLPSRIPKIVQNKDLLRAKLHNSGVYLAGRYLYDHFSEWLSRYAIQSPPALEAYFSGQVVLNEVCQDFIGFCFKKGIVLDKEQTLSSFAHHDALSDAALKRELDGITPAKELKLLGFGLGDGSYEKSLSEYLIHKRITDSVKMYGFDPYAKQLEGIEYLSPAQLKGHTPAFDIITARWVLHHVALKNRWTDFIDCINHSKVNTRVLIVEHGFLRKAPSDMDTKLHYLLNATFDVVANIGIRPHWFTDTAPHIGKNFFVHYLTDKDFSEIKRSVHFDLTQDIYEAGPAFPNQTLCSMRVKSLKKPK